MLRFLVLVLLLANGVFYAWSQGLLKAYGFAPAEVSEPQRLAQQIRPENIRVLRADEVRRIEASPVQASRGPECLLAGPYDEAQTQALRRSLEAGLPVGSWEFEGITDPGRWIIYMGKYPNAQALATKRNELASLNLKYEPLNNPSLEPGLSLGGFSARDAAESALAALAKRGVRTAKVLQERPASQAWQLRLASVDDAMRPRLDEIRPLLADKALRACK